MDEHNHEQCQKCLDVNMEYTITVLRKNKAAEEFMDWFEKVFTHQYAGSASDFSVTWATDDAEDVLEIMQFNPFFASHTLLQLFDSFRSNQEEVKDEFEKDTKKSKLTMLN